MVQQPIATIRDVPLVGHGQDGQHQVHDWTLGCGGNQDWLWQNEHFASRLSPQPNVITHLSNWSSQ